MQTSLQCPCAPDISLATSQAHICIPSLLPSYIRPATQYHVPHKPYPLYMYMHVRIMMHTYHNRSFMVTAVHTYVHVCMYIVHVHVHVHEDICSVHFVLLIYTSSYILVHTYTVYPTLCTRYNIVTLVQFKITIRIWLVKEKCANSYVLLTSVNEAW